MRIWTVLLALAAVVGVASTPARADPVADWYEAVGALSAETGPPGAPADTKVRAQVVLAMFEAANAADPRYTSYLGTPRHEAVGPTAAAAAAAVAVAAHHVLIAAFPTRTATLDQSLAFDLDALPDTPERAEGVRLGEAAAAAVLARTMTTDVTVPDYRPRTAAGVYVPTDLPVLSMGMYAAHCYFLPSPGAVSPPPPPALTSARYARDWDEVRRLGRRTGSGRTPAQSAAAVFWAGNDAALALRILTDRPDRALVANARFYALLAMAHADAAAAITVAKYDNGFWRPITSIRNAADDGADGTAVDPSWEPLLRTPLHPEYPCGHCISAAVTSTVVEAEFGPGARLVFLDPTLPGAARTVTPDQYSDEVSMSRVYAGVHYRFSNEAAVTMGRAIGRLAVDGFMKPLAQGR